MTEPQGDVFSSLHGLPIAAESVAAVLLCSFSAGVMSKKANLIEKIL